MGGTTSETSCWLDGNQSEKLTEARWILTNAGSPIVALRGIAMMKPEMETLELTAVRACRAQGFSWEKIAEALMISKQAVWKQYAERLNETSTEIGPEDVRV